MISRQSKRLSLAYQSRMPLLSLFPLFFTCRRLVPLPVPRATPSAVPLVGPYLISRGPSASTRLWRRGKYVRTPIGAISTSPGSNLGSLERGECASLAVHFSRRTCRKGHKKKECKIRRREEYGPRRTSDERGVGMYIARCADSAREKEPRETVNECEVKKKK